MNRPCVVAVALVLATTATAAAEGLYFSESFGGSDVGDELGAEIHDAVRIKIAVGYRLHARWAVEAWFAADIGTASTLTSDAPVARSQCFESCGDGYAHDPGSAMTSVGVDVKYLRPVSNRVEVYLRGSLGKGWLDGADYAGRGFGVGAGAQLKGKVPALGFLFWPLFFTNWGPKATAALFVDTGADFYRLHKHGQLDNPDALDGSFHRITVGFAVGSDF